MLIGFGAILVVITIGLFALTGLVRRWPMAPFMLLFGLLAFGYWVSIIRWNAWAPEVLLAWFHFWGIGAMACVLGSGVGTMIFGVLRILVGKAR